MRLPSSPWPWGSCPSGEFCRSYDPSPSCWKSSPLASGVAESCPCLRLGLPKVRYAIAPYVARLIIAWLLGKLEPEGRERGKGSLRKGRGLFTTDFIALSIAALPPIARARAAASAGLRC